MRNLIIALSLLVAAACTPALADDFAPPPWRGNPLSVEAGWDFLNTPNNWLAIPPEVFRTVPGPGGTLFGGFATHAEVNTPSLWSWSPGDGDGAISPSASDSIAFKVQNFIDEEPLKLLRMQITWSGTQPPIVSSVSGRDNVAQVPPVGVEVPGGFIERVTVPGAKNWFYEDWELKPNPDWEMVVLQVPQGTVLDQVRIDTISVPEPTTLALLALAGLALRRRR